MDLDLRRWGALRFDGPVLQSAYLTKNGEHADGVSEMWGWQACGVWMTVKGEFVIGDRFGREFVWFGSVGVAFCEALKRLWWDFVVLVT